MAAARTSASSMALRRAAGEVLIAGLEGPSVSTVETAWLKLIRPGGIILFRRNIESSGQTHALLKSARETIDAPLLRCIDVEGGAVDRLRDLTAPMPSAAAVGASGDSRLFAEHGRLIGHEVRMLGLNVTLAPVLDLRTASSVGVMTTRVASNKAAEVVQYARHFLKGLAREGVLGCAKHFPGLGSGQVDSHHATPRIEKSLESLWQEDILPYRKLALPLVMISHAAYPRTPGGSEPASISRFWTTGILAKKIGFAGLIVSDDMEMGGILSQTCLADAVIRSLLAGVHLIEICRDPALVLTAYEALLSEAERSPAFGRQLRRTALTVQKFKQKRLKADLLPAPPRASEVARATGEIQRFAKRVGKLGTVNEVGAKSELS